MPLGKENKMENITVNMTKEDLFDFFLYHAYSKLSGFLCNILGLAVAFMGIFTYINERTNALGCAVYLIAAAGFLGYTPLTLHFRAKKAMEEVALYKKPVEMRFDDEIGIICRQDQTETIVSWEQVRKAVVTPKTIALYIGDHETVIIPKHDFGEHFQAIYMMIARHLGMSRFRQR